MLTHDEDVQLELLQDELDQDELLQDELDQLEELQDEVSYDVAPFGPTNCWLIAMPWLASDSVPAYCTVVNALTSPAP